MKRIFLKPVAGRACPDPDKGGALLPEKGDTVPHNVYWQRRITAGDAFLAEPESTAVVEAASTKRTSAKNAAPAAAGGDQ